MASPDSSTSSPSLHRDSSFSFPLILAFSVPTRAFIINPFTQSMLLIPDDDLPYDTKLGCPPASKKSINAMENVVISECGGHGDQCVVCLEEWRACDVARVMPCGHRFHGDCIEKWLGVNGSCPVCRYEMPPEDEEDPGKKREVGGSGRGGRVWVFSFDFGGIFGGQSDSGESGEADDADSSAATTTEQE